MGDGKHNGSAMRKPTLGVSMIVRNEAANLGRSLASVVDVADQLLIVDAGSTDGTVQIAQSYSAEVTHFTWINDFSAARNAALGRMRTEWVLLLDADEAIAPRDHAELRRLIDQRDLGGYRVATRNYSSNRSIGGWQACDGSYGESEEGQEGWFPSVKVRLFRNDPRVHFSGVVHETVEASLAALGWKVGEASVPVHHYGVVRSREKSERYVAASRENVKRSPRDAQARLEMGLHHFELGEFPEAKKCLEQAIEIQDEYFADAAPGAAANIDAYNVLAALCMQDGDFERAEELLRRAIALRHDDSETYQNLGVALENLGKLDEAKEMTRQALKLNPQNAQAGANLERIEGRQASLARISICMIVKNEAKNIVECLRSFRPLADEIIVVDTGSEDETVELAKREGARVEHFAWCDDFSAARNASLQYATGDYIIWIDADDRIAESDVLKIRSQLVRENPMGYFLKLRNLEPGNRSSISYQLRILPNLPGVAFTGRIHEQSIQSLRRLGTPTSTIDATIDHLGYADVEHEAEKLARNETLLRTQLEEDPDDQFARYMLAIQLETSDEEGEFERLLKTIVERLPAEQKDMSWALHAHVLLATRYANTGRFDEAVEYLHSVLRIDESFWFAEFLLGQINLLRGDFAAARQYLQRIESVDFSRSLIPTNLDDVQFKFHSTYGRCLQLNHEYEKALDHYATAFALRSAEMDFNLWYVECLMRAGREAEVSELVGRLAATEQECGILAFNHGVLAVKLGQPPVAEALFRAAQAIGYENALLYFNLGLAAFHQGDFEETERNYRAAMALDPSLLEARLNLAYVMMAMERREEALGEFSGLVESFPECHEARLRLSSLQLQDDDLDACLQSMNEICALLDVDANRHLETLQDLASLYTDTAVALRERRSYSAASAALDTALLLDADSSKAQTEMESLRYEQSAHQVALPPSR